MKRWPVFLACDPGEIHCGVALFEGSSCVWAKEFRPGELYRLLEQTKVAGVVSEIFQLYPWKARQQSFSQMGVCETIGTMKYILTQRMIPMIEQPASIKKVIELQLRARRIELLAVKNRQGGHAKDAELHGHYYLATTPPTGRLHLHKKGN